MGNGVRAGRVYCFGTFTVDARTGELSQAGRRTPLRDQSLQLLLALLEQPGELVTRDEPDFDMLRSNPRFQKLVRLIRLPQPAVRRP